MSSIPKLSTVILITNIPTPYRIPLFNKLSDLLSENGQRLVVLFGAMGYSRRKWKVDIDDARFEYRVLDSFRLPFWKGEKAVFAYGGLLRELRCWKPSTIITNAFSPATMKLWLMSWVSSCRYIMWSGAIGGEYDRPGLLRRLQRRVLVRRAAGFVAYGSKARDYLVSIGAQPGRVAIGINTVDTEYFRESTGNARASADKIDGAFRLLFVGHLTRRKNVGALFPVVHALLAQGRNVKLDIVGDGEEREFLEAETGRQGLGASITFHGFKQRHEMPEFFSRADCFLFQTDFDIWGLVLVEAMSSGLVCLSSVNAGATGDLVDEGKTGFAVDFDRTDDVVEKLDWLISHPEQGAEIAANAERYIAKEASLTVSASGFRHAIDSFV